MSLKNWGGGGVGRITHLQLKFVYGSHLVYLNFLLTYSRHTIWYVSGVVIGHACALQSDQHDKVGAHASLGQGANIVDIVLPVLHSTSLWLRYCITVNLYLIVPCTFPLPSLWQPLLDILLNL